MRLPGYPPAAFAARTSSQASPDSSRGSKYPQSQPVRIASLQPSVALAAAALGSVDSLCACTRYCLEAVPELRDRNLPILDDSWSFGREPNAIRAAKAALELARPDLLIASVPYRMETLASILRAGYPVLAFAPQTLNDIRTDLRLLGRVLDASHAAEIAIGSMDAALHGVRTYAQTAQSRPRVYCEEWGKPLIRSQRWVAELVDLAAGLFLGTPGSHATAEEVASSDPDVLVFAWCGAGNRVPLQRVIDQRGWQQLRAVRERRAYVIPDQFLNTPAPTVADGLRCLAAAIHPEMFPAPPELRTLSD